MRLETKLVLHCYSTYKGQTCLETKRSKLRSQRQRSQVYIYTTEWTPGTGSRLLILRVGMDDARWCNVLQCSMVT